MQEEQIKIRDIVNYYDKLTISNKRKELEEEILTEIVNIVKNEVLIETVEKYDYEYIITYGDNVTNITKENIDKLTTKYLQDSFNIESIS